LRFRQTMRGTRVLWSQIDVAVAAGRGVSRKRALGIERRAVSGPPGRQEGDPADEHFNSTVLGHAYYLFVREVGHDVAGDVLQYVPFFLSPQPSFQEVVQGFTQRAHDLYGGEVSGSAATAFAQVGLAPDSPDEPEEPDCGPEAC
jgi:hypothetical protein